MALSQFILLTTLLFANGAIGQNESLADLEKVATELSTGDRPFEERYEKGMALNKRLLDLIDRDQLKTGEEFRRASKVVQYARNNFGEYQTRYELMFTAVVLGDQEATKRLKTYWDWFLLGTGRRQRFGSVSGYKGMDVDRLTASPTVKSVETVMKDPVKAQADVAKLTPNAEIRKLVEDDQKARADFFKMTPEQRVEMSRMDEIRRQRLRAMLKDIVLMTAQDYFDASLVMQHGSWFDDYALAHELAICSAMLDPKVGRPMVSVTYDRMLESAGYRQRVGTQYFGTSLTEVDSRGFNDTMRKALGRQALADVPKKIGG